jgi:hypothetical protein
MATILGSVFLNVQSGKYVSAGILGIGFLTISILYGIYMYTPSGDVISRVKSGPWPPTINVCPDFLSLVTVSGSPVCVDPIGTGALRKWTSGQTGDAYIFNLKLTLNGQARINALCDSCRSLGLTWEGVYDGSACLNNQPPIPTGAT